MKTTQGNAIRLFKFTPKKSGDSWELYSASVSPNFYDANEDKASAKPQWFLEAGDLEVEVTDKFSFEQSSKRATFAGSTGIWALRFPTNQAFQHFVNEYNGKLFENIYNVSNDEANREKVGCCSKNCLSHDMQGVHGLQSCHFTRVPHPALVSTVFPACRCLAKTQS